MINAIGIALQGLGFATQKVVQSANKIANPTESDDLATELVNMKVAETSYKANLSVIKTVSEMEEELLHTFDERV
jgi:hypothetical protein